MYNNRRYIVWTAIQEDNTDQMLELSMNVYWVQSYLVFFVLSCIGEAWNNSCYSWCWCNFTCIDHDEHFHQVVIYLSTATLHNIYIFSTHWLSYLDTGNNYWQCQEKNQTRWISYQRYKQIIFITLKDIIMILEILWLFYSVQKRPMIPWSFIFNIVLNFQSKN